MLHQGHDDTYSSEAEEGCLDIKRCKYWIGASVAMRRSCESVSYKSSCSPGIAFRAPKLETDSRHMGRHLALMSQEGPDKASTLPSIVS